MLLLEPSPSSIPSSILKVAVSSGEKTRYKVVVRIVLLVVLLLLVIVVLVLGIHY